MPVWTPIVQNYTATSINRNPGRYRIPLDQVKRFFPTMANPSDVDEEEKPMYPLMINMNVIQCLALMQTSAPDGFHVYQKSVMVKVRADLKEFQEDLPKTVVEDVNAAVRGMQTEITKAATTTTPIEHLLGVAYVAGYDYDGACYMHDNRSAPWIRKERKDSAHMQAFLIDVDSTTQQVTSLTFFEPHICTTKKEALKYRPSPVAAEMARLLALNQIDVIHGAQDKEPACTSYALGFIGQCCNWHALRGKVHTGLPDGSDISVRHLQHTPAIVPLHKPYI